MDMENEIEVCSASDQSSDNQVDNNYDLMSRYYQILLNFLENGASEWFYIFLRRLN